MDIKMCKLLRCVFFKVLNTINHSHPKEVCIFIVNLMGISFPFSFSLNIGHPFPNAGRQM